MNHRRLCEDLARAKGTIYIEVPLGSVFLGFYSAEARLGELMRENSGKDLLELKKQVQKEHINPYKADVVRVRPSYTRFCVDIFEVKVKRADFLKEIRTAKWKGYLDHCHRFYFASLSGVIDKEEVPDECGLIVRGQRGWKIIKLAKKRDPEIPAETLLSLLFYKQKCNFGRIVPYFGSWAEKQKAMKRLGKNIAEAIQYYEEKTGNYVSSEKKFRGRK